VHYFDSCNSIRATSSYQRGCASSGSYTFGLNGNSGNLRLALPRFHLQSGRLCASF